MTPWSHDLFNDSLDLSDRTDSGLLVHRRREPSSGHIACQITLGRHGTVGIPSEAPEPLARILCHFLLEQIPSRGLPEVCESLCEVLEFHSEEPPAPRILPQDVRHVAEVGTRCDRPGFFLEEE